MSTNFYVRRSCPNACAHCSIADLHIGKRSGGWLFGFRGYPDMGLTSRLAWEGYLARGGTIVDEYEREYSQEAFWIEVDATREGKHGAPLSMAAKYGGDGIHHSDPEGWDFTHTEFC